jgi:hypothetical protein
MPAPGEVRTARRGALGIALAAAFLILVGWTLTLRFNRDGSWSALYCHGSVQSLPPEVAAENVYRFEGTGFDGQYYHLIAHDPFFRRGFDRFVDDPRLRWRRGLVPVLAHIMALGQDAWIDVAFRALVLLSACLGVYATSRLVAAYGRHPAWGLAFLALPGVIASLDRLTVDVVLVALTVAFAGAVVGRREGALAAILTLAPLVRETGFLFLGGTLLARTGSRGVLRAAPLLLTALPALAWLAFVSAHTSAHSYQVTSLIPLSALFAALMDPRPYPGKHPAVVLANQVTDAVALGGILLAFALAFSGLRRRPLDEPRVTAALFAAMGVLLQRRDHWDHVFDFGRVYSPLLVLLILDGLRGSFPLPLALAPTLLMLPRVGTQLASQAVGVVKGLFRGA